MHRSIALASILLLAAAAGSLADEPLDKLIYPLAKPPAGRLPHVELVLTEVADNPELGDWGKHAQTVCETWLPIVAQFLATEDWRPPETIRLVMKKELAAPAVTSGATIQISANWVAEHPDDFGMVIHELTHVVQAYPPGQPGWLVEGIADYIRYWRYEPEKPRGPIAPGASYRDGYATSAAFLAWLVQKYDHRIIHRLDKALRKGEPTTVVFQAATGSDVETLWTQFMAELAMRN